MSAALLIDLSLLPEEGKNFNGSLPADIFSFPEGDDARPVSPLSYDLHVQRFDTELLLRGSLSCTFEFTCVVTLSRFTQTIRIPDAAISLEIEKPGIIDATDAVREEIVVELPIHPRCDEADEPRECKIDSPYFVVDKSTSPELISAPPPPADVRWTALDALQPPQDQP